MGEVIIKWFYFYYFQNQFFFALDFYREEAKTLDSLYYKRPDGFNIWNLICIKKNI